MLHNIHNEICCIDENKSIIQVTVADAETSKPIVSLVILWPKMVDGKVSRAERKLNSLRCILTTHHPSTRLSAFDTFNRSLRSFRLVVLSS